MKKRYRKMDFLLIGIILCIAIFAFIYNNQYIHTTANIVRIKVDGKFYKQYALEKDIEGMLTTRTGQTNQFTINHGEVDMINASCPDKRCVDQKRISKDKETIVCLPNNIVIEVISEEKVKYDAVTGH